MDEDGKVNVDASTDASFVTNKRCSTMTPALETPCAEYEDRPKETERASIVIDVPESIRGPRKILKAILLEKRTRACFLKHASFEIDSFIGFRDTNLEAC